jgi:indole-3-glycerol phosphate synthase
MPDFLQAMAKSSAARVAEARSREPEAALWRRARAAAPAPPLRLHSAGFDLIAEIKHRSPSAGRLAPRSTPADITARAAAYARGGAAAVSVLTEPDVFDGALEHLEAATRDLPVPALRKDFLVDPYQVIEARAAGAGGVLLVLRILKNARVREMLEVASELGLFVLLEAFDEDDLHRAAALVPVDAPGTILFGVNARNLADLTNDDTRHARLARAIPPGRPRVAESGIADAADVRRAVGDGYRLALVGGALMRAPDPAALVAELIAAGRAGAGAP